MLGPVLIVEDDRTHRKIYSTVLKAYDYRPIEIIDPKAAFLAAIRAAPIAIIVDIILPPVDGRDVIRQLRRDERTRAIPILAVSAAGNPLAASCIDAGADCFRAKPWPLMTIIEDIRMLTEGPGSNRSAEHH